MTDTPEGLVPVGDGTCYGPGYSVPSGWHWRWRDDNDWFDVPVYSSHMHRFVQCRPAPDPDPLDELVRRVRAGLPPTVSPESVDAIEVVLRQTYDHFAHGPVEDDPADTEAQTVAVCGARNPLPGHAGEDCILPPGHHYGHINGPNNWPATVDSEPVSSGRVPTEGDDTTGRNELTPQERLLADASRDAAILRHIATSADDLNTPDDGAVAGHLRYAARTTDRLAALVRDAQPLPDATELARLFHDTYETLAPKHGYKTRTESAVPWDQVPIENRRLMIHTCSVVLAALADRGVR